MQQLIKVGSKKLLFATDKYGRPTLHLASAHDCVEAVWLLIKAAGKKLLQTTDIEGSSALPDASDESHVESLRLLIEAGGMEQVLLRNQSEHTALHSSAFNGH